MSRRLLDAIDAGDREAGQRLLEAGADPDQCLEGRYSLLMHCAATGNRPFAELLLRFGADPALRDDGGTNAAGYARARGHHELAEHLERAEQQRSVHWSKEEEDLLRSIWGAELYESVKHRLAPRKRSPESDGSAAETPKTQHAGEAPGAAGEPVSETVEEIVIEELVGQERAKESLRQAIAMARLNQERRTRGMKAPSITLHAIFMGSPGTGKTTFARFYAQEIRRLGILDKGHLVEVSRADLVAEYAGQTAARTGEVVERALGGVLFVDEAYALKQGDSDAFGQECIDTLVKHMEDHRDQLILILAGYTDEMREFLQQNTGLRSRIPNKIEFEDFTDAELGAIFDIFCRKAGVSTHEGNRGYAIEEIARNRKGHSFGNARDVRNVFERALAQQSVRLSRGELSALSAEEISTLIHSDLTPDPADHGEERQDASEGRKGALARLQDLVGLDQVKQSLEELSDFVKVSRARSPGASLPELSLHMVFSGNPGTGKTTVARLLGEILHELGFLATGHVVEVERADLVAGYLGQTALKTQQRVGDALGGILFLDEAYTLARRDDAYGQEALDAILKDMEDRREQLVVVFAGYPREMEILLASNPGLRSRFGSHLEFPDYTTEELLEIGARMATERGFSLSDAAREALCTQLDAARADARHFANAREVRNRLERAYRRQATRILRDGGPEAVEADALGRLEAEDLAG